MTQEIEIRCERCGWHLVDVGCSDSSDFDFYVKKTCPRCKTKNTIKVLKFKRINTAPAS